MEQIDRVAIAPLKARYGHRKFYTEYVPVLGIHIQKEGKNGYISQYEAELLEKYHEARGRGKEAVTEFLALLERIPEHVTPNKSSILEHVPTRTGTFEQIPPTQLLQLADSLPQLSPVGRWLATDWVLQVAAMQRIVIIRSVLLVLLDREKLPRLRRFRARGFEFWRVDDRSSEEWLAKLVENYD
ncbi:hypothetical protein NIES592_08220 [Fischerella major NIES-592]|uniref:Uncharacterized protein n=1 Tax=Fischerella major NIES-592 TaxID=210994 RepID=A0A1U7H1J7_9CYAN|nr:hypothetical protein [Fischerella major]OKH14853.1 hypothetical protein NIES592_08220 [Fischerella major NIES-592]